MPLIDLDSAYRSKLLCDGLSLDEAGLNGEDVAKKINAELKQLSVQPDDHRVIYAFPIMKAGTSLESAEETIEVCKTILSLTGWQIRLLSKSSILPQVAEAIPEKWKWRMIYGVATGTLDDALAPALDGGVGKYSDRIESLHQLQDMGCRTFGMISPILPQEDYDQYAKAMVKAIRFDLCEHVWAEMINPEDQSFNQTLENLSQAGFGKKVLELQELSDEYHKREWEAACRAAYFALVGCIPRGKLRFLQIIARSQWYYWDYERGQGAVSLREGVENEELRPQYDIQKLKAAFLNSGKLTGQEKARFGALHEKVQTAAKSFVEAGLALMEIKRDKLYREDYSSFEDYCRSVHEISRQHANNLVRAGQIYRNLETIVSKDERSLLPKREGQVRELSRISGAEVQLSILKTAASAGKITAQSIANLVDAKLNKAPRADRKSSSQRVAHAASVLNEIEAKLGNDASQEVLALLNKMRSILEGKD